MKQMAEELDEIYFDDTETEEATETFLSSNINTNIADPDFFTLVRRINNGTINLQPDFQRGYVWDNHKASKLIESILLGIPLPTIYLAEEANGKEVVIDGQQRLTAVKLFMENEFKLIGIQSFPELNKKLFKELPDDKMKTIENGSIRTITFRKDSDEDLKFAIFERLNTGSVPLNDMELRNCIYRGNYIELLKKMAENTTFRKLIGIKTADKRMKDVELVLRFSALYHATYLNYEAPIKTFLNKDAKKYQKINIVTNHIEKFKKIEEQLLDEYGVMITLNNNKRKSLAKADIILNFDFPEELINKYRIAEKAIIVNFRGNAKIKQKRFEGKIFNDYDIVVQNLEEFQDYASKKFYIKDIYEALIYKHQPIENIMRKVEKDKVGIKFLK